MSAVFYMLLTIALYAVVAMSLAVAVFFLLRRALDRSALLARLRPVVRQTPSVHGRRPRPFPRLLPAAAVDRLITSFNLRRAQSALPISWQAFLALSFVSAATGLALGLLHFRNLLAGLLMAFMGLLLPDQILSLGAGAHREKTSDQFQLAIQIFAAEYRAVRSVPRAFLRTVPQLPEPMRSHFERASTRLNVGEPPAPVLDDLAESLSHPFAPLFVSNCRSVMENQRSAALFDAIAHQLNQWRIRQAATTAALAGGRTTGFILNASLPLLYLGQLRLQPVTHEFLTTTAGGRALLVLILLGALLTFGLNRFLEKVDW